MSLFQPHSWNSRLTVTVSNHFEVIIPLSSSFHCLVKKSALSLKILLVMNYLFYAFKIFLTWFDLNLWKTWGLSLRKFFSKEDLHCFIWHLRTMLTQKHSCSPASRTRSQSFRLSSLMGHSTISLQCRLWIPARVGFASLAIEGLGLGGCRVLFLFCFAPLIISRTSYEHRKGGIISSSRYFVVEEHPSIPSQAKLLGTEVSKTPPDRQSHAVPTLSPVSPKSWTFLDMKWTVQGLLTLSALIRN